MIYLDTSVALAELFAEDRKAPASIWDEPLISSRLLEYELWVRLHARHAGPAHEEAARAIMARISLVELLPMVLTRALEPFPLALRTLDALHLATLSYLRGVGQKVRLASFDERMRQGAIELDVPLAF